MIQLWGHRGCRGKDNPPENSLPAFQAAIDQSADGIELDVFLTRDNHLVVFHDDTLDRMSNGSGNITDYTLAELQKLRLKGPTGDLTEAKIPTLDDVLNLVEKQRPKGFTVNIEIKEMKGKNIADEVSRTIGKRLTTSWLAANFQVSSFDMNSLRAMKKARPGIPLGALFADKNESRHITESTLEKCLRDIGDLHPATINLTLPSLTPGTVKLIRATGAAPLAWTCNEINPALLSPPQGRALATQLMENNIGVLITDYPQQMRFLLTPLFS